MEAEVRSGLAVGGSFWKHPMDDLLVYDELEGGDTQGDMSMEECIMVHLSGRMRAQTMANGRASTRWSHQP